jgi:hypothetical protein
VIATRFGRASLVEVGGVVRLLTSRHTVEPLWLGEQT